MRRLSGYCNVCWERWGIGLNLDIWPPLGLGSLAGAAFVELRLGPLAIGVGYHWWRMGT